MKILRRSRNHNNKNFSILGDSISTLEGYNPHGYNIFYDKVKQKQAGVLTWEDTWWGMVIKHFSGKLLVNNSWSGSRVAAIPGSKEIFPSACSEERTAGLHSTSQSGIRTDPDIIIIYIGTNDWGFGTPLKSEPGVQGFAEAYQKMLAAIHINYPNAEIWCCSLMPTCMQSKDDFVFPYYYGGIHMKEYNNIIKKCVKSNHKNHVNICYMDTYKHSVPYDSIDGSHPTAAGMKTIADLIIRESPKR